MWPDIVSNRADWMGGILANDKLGYSTVIMDIKLIPNDRDSHYLEVKGERFSCGFDIKHGGVLCSALESGVLLSHAKGDFVMHRTSKQRGLEIEA